MYKRTTSYIGDGRISLWRYIIPCTWNSYPRSRHVEADAQVTHKALCLLHNTPAQLQGIKRRNGWFLEWACKCTKSPHPTLITCVWLSDVYSLLLKTFYSEITKSWTNQESAITYTFVYTTSLHIHPEGALRREATYSTITDIDHSLSPVLGCLWYGSFTITCTHLRE